MFIVSEDSVIILVVIIEISEHRNKKKRCLLGIKTLIKKRTMFLNKVRKLIFYLITLYNPLPAPKKPAMINIGKPNANSIPCKISSIQTPYTMPPTIPPTKISPKNV